MNKPLTPDTDDFTIPSSPWLIVMNIGLLMIVAGTALPLLHVDAAVWRYIYCAGALLALLGRVCAPAYKGSVTRVRRLGRIEFWSCIVFCVAGFFMWYEPEQPRDWIAFTLAGGALQVYASIMTARTLSKELARRKKSSGDSRS